MEPAAQEASSYFLWQVPGKPVAVRLHLDVVDRLGAEVMRGFGAVPKRGAEVGGILLGSIEPGEVTIVKVEDFEAVPCRYSRGPSYLLSEADRAQFEEALNRWQGDSFGTAVAVGFFRSHTREGLGLAEEDLELLNRYFRDPAQVALLVKPFATKASIAGFFVREGGQFPAETPLQFPFRRREITGEAPPPRRSLLERRQRSGEPVWEEPRVEMPAPVRRDAEDLPPAPASRRKFFEFTPLALLLLLAGLIAGFGVALQFAPLVPARSAIQYYGLGLTVARTGENLTLRWNPEAYVLRYAQRGLLEIEDGSLSKPVELDAAHLRDASVIYQNASKLVRFRLSVSLDQRLTVSEAIEWRE